MVTVLGLRMACFPPWGLCRNEIGSGYGGAVLPSCKTLCLSPPSWWPPAGFQSFSREPAWVGHSGWEAAPTPSWQWLPNQTGLRAQHSWETNLPRIQRNRKIERHLSQLSQSAAPAARRGERMGPGAHGSGTQQVSPCSCAEAHDAPPPSSSSFPSAHYLDSPSETGPRVMGWARPTAQQSTRQHCSMEGCGEQVSWKGHTQTGSGPVQTSGYTHPLPTATTSILP